MIGKTIGPYQILAELGRGGMGEVYRARDSRLGRDVALKILPEAFAQDADRLARFRREAQVLASLNHPNIAQVYGLEDSGGTTALVMELVEGPTLDELLRSSRPEAWGVRHEEGVGHEARGVGAVTPPGQAASPKPHAPGPRGPRAQALPLDDALAIARQIAEALEAAHEQGIVHRDLKPANVKVRPDGTVKVLDFGLAKALTQAPGPTPEALSQSPTLTTPAMPFDGRSGHPEQGRGVTEMGMILGTAAYMAPEQARGRPVDRRADIWAFGVILWEMCAGRQLFAGETVSDTIAAVLRETPDLSVVPAEIRRAVAVCLERDPRRRLRDIGDLRLLLDETNSNADEPAAGVPVASRRGWLWPALATAAVLVAAPLAFVALTGPAPERSPMVTFELPPTGFLMGLSQDGRQLLINTSPTESEPSRLWVRSLDALEMRQIPGTEGAVGRSGTAWSPDGGAVAYVADDSLRRTDVVTGQTTTLLTLSTYFFPLAWTPDGTILYDVPDGSVSGENGIWRVSQAGGTPVQVTHPEDPGEIHRVAGLLPGGRRFLYLVVRRQGGQSGAVRVGSLDVGPDAQDATTVVESDAPPVYVEPRGDAADAGHLLFLRRDTLLAAPFDVSSGALVGEPVTIASGLSSAQPQAAGEFHLRSFLASRTGVLAYITGEFVSWQSELVRMDRAGKRLATIGPPGVYEGLNLFEDGTRLAVGRQDGPFEPAHVQIVDVARAQFTRLSPESALDYAAIPGGSGDVAYSYSPDGGARDIYVRAANGAGSPRLLVSSETTKHVNDWSPDGRFLIYDDHRPGMAQDLFIVPSGGGEPIPFLATTADESPGAFSPDGQWIAYQSDESGRKEVYVRDFDPTHSPAYGTERVQVSVDGGDKPRWSADGRRLYFLRLDDTLTEVDVRPGRPFGIGTPTALFPIRPISYMPYDVFPDGTFVVESPVEQDQMGLPVVVTLNWEQALRTDD